METHNSVEKLGQGNLGKRLPGKTLLLYINEGGHWKVKTETENRLSSFINNT